MWLIVYSNDHAPLTVRPHIVFFKTKNCSNDDIFISCDDRIGKMLHNICMSAVAMSLRWANRGPWASCVAPALAGQLRWASFRPFIHPSVRLYVNIYPGCLVSATPLTVLYRSFRNFACVFFMVWSCACGFDVIVRLFFVPFSTLWT